MKRTIVIILAIALSLALAAPALAASETEEAAAYLAKRGILKGDASGNLNLSSGLNRAELAAILTRLDFMDTPRGLAEWDEWGEEHFSDPENIINKFTDIPAWALPYVEYCYECSLMKGTSATRFDPQGKVSPKMACTVVLRYCRIAETDWSYDTSLEKARAIGIAPADGMGGDIILRGTMAVMICRGIRYAENDASQNGDAQDATASPPPCDVLPPQATTTPAEMKAELIRLTNAERAKAGLPALEPLPALMDCAQAKARDIIDTGYHAHYSPNYGTHNEMISSFVPGVSGGWENTALGPASTAKEVLQVWMDSDGHRGAILQSKTTHIGVGVAVRKDGRYAWVQQFIKL